jgi:predicted Zn-dependent protease
MENEADHLGLRYMTREDYDPRHLVRVMGVLDRVTREAGGSRMPDWLSTHPSPENRSARIRAELAATATSGSVTRTAEYVSRLDGMVFGENPREGYFIANAFYHPDLRFRIGFPAGFKTQNERQAVVGVSEAQDAAVLLTLAAGASPEEAARAFFSRQQGMTIGRSGRDSIGGLPAYTASFEAATEEGVLRGQVSFVTYDGRTYRILGYAPAASFGRYQSAFDRSIRSFGPLSDPRYLNVQPRRIALVNLDRQMALPEFARTYPSTVKEETIGLINGVEANQMIPGGELAKRVVGGRLPE